MSDYVVTEEDFHKAINNAPAWVRQRIFKKMTKKVVDKENGGFRPPKDLEQYVTNFVLTYKDKA